MHASDLNSWKPVVGGWAGGRQAEVWTCRRRQTTTSATCDDCAGLQPERASLVTRSMRDAISIMDKHELFLR